MWLTNCRRDR